jgi:hypothetical protein
MLNVKPAGATPDIVAQYATRPHVLKRSRTSLLGLFGPADKMRALVRLPGGKVQQVEPGQRLAGGRIVAIDADGIMLLKNGETGRLSIPGG